jgi:tetratricopeptide (TPR) repeat protein
VLNYLSHRRATKEEAIANCEEARQLLVELGALDLSDLGAASVYADTSDSQARHALVLGRVGDAARLEQEVYTIAEKVLAQRPGDLRSMANRALAADLLGRLADRRHDHVVAARYGARSEEAGEDYVRFNPSDLNAWVYWIRGKDLVADALFEQGRVLDSIGVQRSAVALEKDSRAPSNLALLLNLAWFDLAGNEALAGERVAAEKSFKEAVRAQNVVIAQEPAGSTRRALWQQLPNGARARLQLHSGQDESARDTAVATVERLKRIEPAADDRNARGVRDNFLRSSLTTQAIAAIRLRRYAEAEAASRERLALAPNPFGSADPEDERSRARVVLAHAIARQGRGDEARKLVQPVLERYRGEQKRGASGTSFQRDLAYALYVSAIVQANDASGRARRDATLAEATRVLGGMSLEARHLADVREVAGWIAADSVGGD